MTLPPLRIALAQIAPRLGLFDENLAVHHELLDEARGRGAGLVVFPELGPHRLPPPGPRRGGRDPARRPAPRRRSRPRPTACRPSSRSSRSRPTTACSSRRRCSRTAEIRHVHRKLFLPTYGLFDERRFFAAGDLLRATPSRLGVGIGIAVCEDFWHLTVPQLLALDGAQILINVSSSPGRDLAATNEVGPRDRDLVADADADVRPADDLVRRVLQPRRRRRVDLVLGRLGGHRPERPGAVHARRCSRRACSRVDVPLADVRRERLTLPLLRDERPELRGPRADADRRRAGRARARHDRRRAGRGRRSTSRRATRSASRSGSGRGAGRRAGEPAEPARGRRGGTAGDDRRRRALFELPDELAIDTDVARRVIGQFIRGQLRQAGFERLVLGLSGGIDSALVAYLVRRGDRARSGCCAC